MAKSLLQYSRFKKIESFAESRQSRGWKEGMYLIVSGGRIIGLNELLDVEVDGGVGFWQL